MESFIDENRGEYGVEPICAMGTAPKDLTHPVCNGEGEGEWITSPTRESQRWCTGPGLLDKRAA
jgi:hypothetical protein